jgi:hypothetical protein
MRWIVHSKDGFIVVGGVFDVLITHSCRSVADIGEHVALEMRSILVLHHRFNHSSVHAIRCCIHHLLLYRPAQTFAQVYNYGHQKAR